MAFGEHHVRQGCIHPLDHGLWRRRKLWEKFLAMPVGVKGVFPEAGKECTWIGWGRKKSGLRAERLGHRDGCGFLLLEDGFLRSFGLGRDGALPGSILVDDVGVHYDATRPSRLELSLQEGQFTDEELDEAGRIIDVLRKEGLSKYNTGLSVPDDFFEHGEDRVLLVDQTARDSSLTYGMVGAEAFSGMLEAALGENPEATIYVKTHPDVLAGHRKGCVPHIDHGRVRWLTENWHPHDVLAHFDKVYVMTSLMGLDALVMGKEVHCFGLPFYAGWGLTKDRQKCPRRTRQCSLEELISCAFLRHARYINPETGEPGDFFDVARYVSRQKRMLRFWERLKGKPWSGRVFAFGFKLWKHEQVRPFFGRGVNLTYVRSVAQARRMGINSHDRIAVWGIRDPAGLSELASELGLHPVRVEDGFIRSAGLGSDFIPPLSLVFDSKGIYFDPARESDLEHMLNSINIDYHLRERARKILDMIISNRLTKYNFKNTNKSEFKMDEKCILVPGQVEGDASILRGGCKIKTNLDLLHEVRNRNPKSCIIYRPHPDIVSRNRWGGLHLSKSRKYCTHIDLNGDLIRVLESSSEVHTMTSLTGFDALLRGKHVVCYGKPFYAGWGLTEDRCHVEGRHRNIGLEELVAAALILYPRYASKDGFLSIETAIRKITSNLEKTCYCRNRFCLIFVRLCRYIYYSLLSIVKKHERSF